MTAFDPIVISSIIGVLSVAILVAVVSGEPPKISADGKWTIVAYGRIVKSVVIALAAGLIVLTTMEYFDRSKDRGVLFFLVLMTTLSGPFLLFEVFRTRIEYDNDNLKITTAFKKQRTFPWPELAGISYLHWRSSYQLQMRDGTTLVVSELLTGVDAFLKFARRWSSYNQTDR